MNLLIKERLNLLLKTLPNNINDEINTYNSNIIKYISLIENNYYINNINNVSTNINNYPLNELFNEIKSNLKNYINILNKENDNKLIISNIYKCILQLIIECEYLYININEVKNIEGFSFMNLNLNCYCKSFVFIVILFFIIYLVNNKMKNIL